jgi:hypothetical protein
MAAGGTKKSCKKSVLVYQFSGMSQWIHRYGVVGRIKVNEIKKSIVCRTVNDRKAILPLPSVTVRHYRRMNSRLFYQVRTLHSAYTAPMKQVDQADSS